MPKKPKKLSSVRRKRRPKSIYKRMWETRRKNAALKVLTSVDPKNLYIDKEAVAKELERLAWRPKNKEEAELKAFLGPKTVAAMENFKVQEPTTGSTIPSRSEINGGDALVRMAVMNRDDLLCDFLGDVNAMRMMRVPLHAPVVVSRSQLEAIEEFLLDHGYSMFGKGSGRLASVSTNPNTKSA